MLSALLRRSQLDAHLVDRTKVQTERTPLLQQRRPQRGRLLILGRSTGFVLLLLLLPALYSAIVAGAAPVAVLIIVLVLALALVLIVVFVTVLFVFVIGVGDAASAIALGIVTTPFAPAMPMTVRDVAGTGDSNSSSILAITATRH